MRRFLTAVLALTVAIFPATTAAAEPPDTDAPNLVEFTPSKTVLDTGSDDRSMSFVIRATDTTGIANLSFYCSDVFAGSTSMWFTVFPGNNSARINFDGNAAVTTTATIEISGDQTDHTWIVNFTVPYNRPDSSCSAWTVVSADTQGNRGRDSVFPGLEIRQVRDPVDTEPAKVDVSSVVVSNGSPSLGETINIRFRVTDDTAIGNVSVFVWTPEPNQTSIRGLFATKVSGSSTDAVYSVDVTFPASPYPAGTWKIDLAPQDIYNKGGPRWPVYVNVSRPDLNGQTENIGASGEQAQLQIQKAGSQLVIYSEIVASGTFEVFEDDELIDTFTLGETKTAHVIEQRVTGEIRIERADSNGSTAVEVMPTRSLLWYQNYNLGLVNPSSLNSTQRAAVNGLARSYKAVNGTWTPREQSTSKFICTGIYGPGASFADKVDARKRAKVACETAQSMNPGSDVSFWYQTKETKALSYVNKVLITVKGLEAFIEEGLR